MLRTPTAAGAAGHRRARRPRGRRQAARGAGRARRGRRRSPRRTSPRNPALVRATSARGARRASSESKIRYLVDPRVVRRHPLGHRRQRARQARARPRRGPRLHARTASSRPPRCAPGDPCPAATARRRRSSPRAASRSATSSSSAASTPRRSTSRCSTRTASSSPSRWARTASASSRAVAAIAETTHDEIGLSGRARSRPPTCTSWRPARTRQVFDRRGGARRGARRPRGVDRALRRPAEGVAGREVQGRRAARHARRSSWSARAWPTARRGARPRVRRA